MSVSISLEINFRQEVNLEPIITVKRTSSDRFL